MTGRADSRTAELLEGGCDVDLDALDVDLAARGFSAAKETTMTNERGRAAPERAVPDVRAKSRFTVTMNLDLAEDEIDAIKTEIRETIEGWLSHTRDDTDTEVTVHYAR